VHARSSGRTVCARAVGASSAGAQWATPDFQLRKDWFAQLEENANRMIGARFLPLLDAAGAKYEARGFPRNQ
jgi:hypothetical protein